MRRTHLFTVHELRQGWLESWTLTSSRMPTARSIELRVVRHMLHGGGDEAEAHASPLALYRDASRVPWRGSRRARSGGAATASEQRRGTRRSPSCASGAAASAGAAAASTPRRVTHPAAVHGRRQARGLRAAWRRSEPTAGRATGETRCAPRRAVPVYRQEYADEAQAQCCASLTKACVTCVAAAAAPQPCAPQLSITERLRLPRCARRPRPGARPAVRQRAAVAPFA
jgi:hypothetical protein